MGLLDSIAGQVAGALAGARGGAGSTSGLMDAVATLLGGAGGAGLPGLVRQFERQGLGHVVQSWIGTGENLAITPEQVRSVLGDAHVEAVAARIGLSTTDVANQLAGLLPHAVDSVTPEGALPHGNVLSEALEAFAALRR